MGGKIVALDINTMQEWALQLGNTLILFLVLRWLLYKPVYNFLEKRKASIKSKIDEANFLKEEVSKMKEEYEAKIKDVKKEADEILKFAHKKAMENETEITAKAKEEAENIKRRTMSDMEMAKEQAKLDIRNEIIDVSTVMTKKIIDISIDENKHRELIDESIKEIGDVKWLA